MMIKAWLKTIRIKSFNFFSDEKGATATEYATLIVLLVFVIAATVYTLADFEGDGVAQKAFQKVGNQAGQFGKVQN